MTKPRIGMIGLGRLGLPVAVAISEKGYRVTGYDIDNLRMSKLPQKYIEAGPYGYGDFNSNLAESDIHFAKSVQELAQCSDIIFVAVQTPHAPALDGTQSFKTSHLEDFDYTYVAEALQSLSHAVTTDKVVSIISTMLPGSYDKYLRYISDSNPYLHIVYNPFFIAMGTTMRDFLNPEFVLMGLESDIAANALDDFYRDVLDNDAPRLQMSIASAEATKVLYNVALSAKLTTTNYVQMVCDGLDGANAQDVLSAMQLANQRLVSTSYMNVGMGDGGGCHPRDLLALGWYLNKKLNQTEKYNWFASIMQCREGYAQYLAEKLLRLAEARRLPICIYGYAFKANTAITNGSHALLVAHLLRKKFGQQVELYDPIIDKGVELKHKRVYLVGAAHLATESQMWPGGSVVLDPWHIVPPDAPGAEVIRVG